VKKTESNFLKEILINLKIFSMFGLFFATQKYKGRKNSNVS